MSPIDEAELFGATGATFSDDDSSDQEPEASPGEDEREDVDDMDDELEDEDDEDLPPLPSAVASRPRRPNLELDDDDDNDDADADDDDDDDEDEDVGADEDEDEDMEDDEDEDEDEVGVLRGPRPGDPHVLPDLVGQLGTSRVMDAARRGQIDADSDEEDEEGDGDGDVAGDEGEAPRTRPRQSPGRVKRVSFATDGALTSILGRRTHIDEAREDRMGGASASASASTSASTLTSTGTRTAAADETPDKSDEEEEGVDEDEGEEGEEGEEGDDDPATADDIVENPAVLLDLLEREEGENPGTTAYQLLRETAALPNTARNEWGIDVGDIWDDVQERAPTAMQHYDYVRDAAADGRGVRSGTGRGLDALGRPRGKSRRRRKRTEKQEALEMAKGRLADANLAFANGQLSVAREAATDAVRMGLCGEDTYQLLGMVYEEMQQGKKALDCFTLAAVHEIGRAHV